MPRKKPCKICRRWFQPHPRAGSRQKACEDCQAERHRRACARWHEANPHDDKKRRLRAAAKLDDVAEADDPIEAVLWSVVEQAIGPAHGTMIEGIARLLAGTAASQLDLQAYEAPRVPGPVVFHAEADDRGRVRHL